MKNDSPTILIIKYRALGDSVMGLSTISYLRSIYPNSKIYYGVRAWTAKLFKNIHTDADEIFPISLESAKDILPLFLKIKSLKIDHIHELHLSGRTKKFFKIVSFLLGIRYTYHNHHEKNGEVYDQGVIKPLIQRDLDGAYTFLGKVRKEIPPNYLSFKPNVMLLSQLPKKKRIIFGVVATRETKMWPLENYVNLASHIKNEFSEYTIVALLSKSSEDEKIANKLKNLDKDHLIQIENIGLENLFSYFSESTLYVGNDTGLKHVAIAAGIKSYTMFGPEPANEWHPYDKDEHPYFYIDNLECRTRSAHYCGLSTCDSMICMSLTDARGVYKEIKKDLI